MKAQINRVVIEINEIDLLLQPAAALVVQTGPDLRLPLDVVDVLGVNIQQYIRSLGQHDPGTASLIRNVQLKSAALILAVMPRWSNGSERTLVASATYQCLQLAETHALASIALPSLMPGTRAYPIEQCATTMLSQIVDFTFEDLEHVRTITLCLADPLTHDIFEHELIGQIDELRRTGDGDVAL